MRGDAESRVRGLCPKPRHELVGGLGTWELEEWCGAEAGQVGG